MADNGFKINKSVNFNPQAGAPANPIDGDFYYDSVAQSFAYYHGGSWANMDSVGTVAAALSMTGATTFTSDKVINSVIKVTGGAATSHLYGIASSFSGKHITVYNATAFTIVVHNEDATELTANNKIKTPTGGSMNLVAGEVAVFMYDATAIRWILVSISSNAGAQVIATTVNPGIVTLDAVGGAVSKQHADISSLNTWQLATTPAGLDAVQIRAYAWSGAKWAALTGSNAAVSSATSAEGTNWVEHAGQPLGYWESMAYGNGRFVAVCENQVAHSTDGVTWTAYAVTARLWQHVIFANGKFVALATDAPDAGVKVMYSATGLSGSWTNITPPGAAANSWYTMCWTGSLYVAMGSDTGAGNACIVMTSPDAITWTLGTPPVGMNLMFPAWNGSICAAVGTDTSGHLGVATSPTGEVWTTGTLPADYANLGVGAQITSIGGVFVAAVVVRDNAVLVSKDGINWRLRKTPGATPTALWRRPVAGNGFQFIMGSDGGGGDATHRILVGGIPEI